MKITQAKVNEFLKHTGDFDKWIQANGDKGGIITGDEWSFLQNLISEWKVLLAETASEEMIRTHDEKYLDQFDDQLTYNYFFTNCPKELLLPAE